MLSMNGFFDNLSGFKQIQCHNSIPNAFHFKNMSSFDVNSLLKKVVSSTYRQIGTISNIHSLYSLPP